MHRIPICYLTSERKWKKCCNYIRCKISLKCVRKCVPSHLWMSELGDRNILWSYLLELIFSHISIIISVILSCDLRANMILCHFEDLCSNVALNFSNYVFISIKLNIGWGTTDILNISFSSPINKMFIMSLCGHMHVCAYKML